MRNKRPDLNGVLVVDKPLGWTSADVCRFVRSRTGGAKVGHAGTLDPLATGVLVVCLGTATKRIDEIMAGRKRYLAGVDLSAFSTTDDAEGERTPVAVDSPPTAARVREVCAGFVGRVMQRPPAYSAIKVGGERSYRLARKGEAKELEARPVEIDSIEVVAYAWPRLEIEVLCGKGTYIRSLARDLGAALGTGGMLASLRRTAVGEFAIGSALGPDEAVAGLPSSFVCSTDGPRAERASAPGKATGHESDGHPPDAA